MCIGLLKQMFAPKVDSPNIAQQSSQKRHKIYVMSARGDSVLTDWEPTNADEIEFARGVFNKARKDGWGALYPTPEGSVALEKFLPEVEEIYLLKPIAGG